MFSLMGNNDMYRRKAFTLIELLMVISIIALLLAILMPALNNAREQATAAVCLGNQRTMIQAWQMYADENDDYMIGGNSYYNGNPFNPSLNDPWPGVMYAWCFEPGYRLADGKYQFCSSSNVTDEYRLNGIRKGKMYPYVNTTDIYNCPGDGRWRKNQHPYDTYRSYSISGMMYGEDARPTHNYLNAYVRVGQIKSPAEKFVMVEEGRNNQWHNYGSWILYAASRIEDYSWWDEFAVWHNGRSTFNFADGRAEIKTWEDKRTIQMSEHPQGGDIFMRSNRPINPDLLWAARGYGGVPY